MSESVVYCEGYHDRAFWAGWLQTPGLHRSRCAAASGSNVAAATFSTRGATKWKPGNMRTIPRAEQFLRVVPCGERTILASRRPGIDSLTTDTETALPRWCFCVDPDANAAGIASTTTG